MCVSWSPVFVKTVVCPQLSDGLPGGFRSDTCDPHRMTAVIPWLVCIQRLDIFWVFNKMPDRLIEMWDRLLCQLSIKSYMNGSPDPSLQFHSGAAHPVNRRHSRRRHESFLLWICGIMWDFLFFCNRFYEWCECMERPYVREQREQKALRAWSGNDRFTTLTHCDQREWRVTLS